MLATEYNDEKIVKAKTVTKFQVMKNKKKKQAARVADQLLEFGKYFLGIRYVHYRKQMRCLRGLCEKCVTTFTYSRAN